MRTRQTLLFLAASRLQASTWEGGAFSAAQCFYDDASGREQFAAFLRTQRAPACLLADLVEEDYRIEVLPPVRGRERTRLIRRKLEQCYRDTPFRRVQPLAQRAPGLHDSEVALCALTNPALITPWLEVMREQGVALAGIHSVAAVSSALAADGRAPHLLLLSWERQAGLRQSYFAAGLLRFSRLTPLAAQRELAEAVAAESLRTRQYLRSQGWLPAGQMLEVRTLCHTRDMDSVTSRMAADGGMRHDCLDIGALARRHGLKPEMTDSDATPLLLHLLATRPPRSQYGDAGHTRIFRVQRRQRALLAGAALVCIAGLGWSLLKFEQQRELTAENAILRERVAALARQAQADTRRASFRAPADMQGVLLAVRTLQGRALAPRELLNEVSAALDVFPRIRLEQLSWQAGDAGQAVILLGGELTGFTGDYRNALEHLERFRSTLERRGHAVTAQNLPLDVSPGGNIAARANEGGTTSARFLFRMAWRGAA